MLQKIQAIYFKIQGTYFKIYALYFSQKLTSDFQQLTNALLLHIYIHSQHPYAHWFPHPSVSESARKPADSPAETNRLALFEANMLLTNINNCFLDF